MEVLFAGICLWETRSRAPGVVGLMPNGVLSGNAAIPPHTACIIVEATAVDDSDWGDAPQQVTFEGTQNNLYRLRGDEITFSPEPTGGTPSIGDLPRPTCAAGKDLDSALLGAQPSSATLQARIPLPGTAALRLVLNRHGAKVTTLTVDDGTELVSMPFGGAERRLRFLGSNPSVIVGNFDLSLALASNPEGPDDDHAILYCPMFTTVEEPPLFAMRGDIAGELLSSIDAADVRRLPPPHETNRSHGRRYGDGVTIGSGCSNSQWP